MENMMASYKAMKASLFEEGYFDERLQLLWDGNDPKNVFDIMELFLNNAEKKIMQLHNILSASLVLDYPTMDLWSTICGEAAYGATKISTATDALYTNWTSRNRRLCIESLDRVTVEFMNLRNIVVPLMKLAKEIHMDGVSTS